MNKTNSDIFFSTRDELTKVCLDDVMYVVSDGNYINLNFKSGRTVTLLASLQNFIQVTQSTNLTHFVRIGRSYVINTAYVSQVNSLRKTITLVDDNQDERIELSASREAVRSLKAALLDSPKTPIADFNTSNGNMEAYQLIK